MASFISIRIAALLAVGLVLPAVAQTSSDPTTDAAKKEQAHEQIKKTHSSGVAPDAVGPDDKASPTAQSAPTSTPVTPPK